MYWAISGSGRFVYKKWHNDSHTFRERRLQDDLRHELVLETALGIQMCAGHQLEIAKLDEIVRCHRLMRSALMNGQPISQEQFIEEGFSEGAWQSVGSGTDTAAVTVQQFVDEFVFEVCCSDCAGCLD